MTGFEPRTSGIGSNRSTNWATTTAQLSKCLFRINRLSIDRLDNRPFWYRKVKHCHFLKQVFARLHKTWFLCHYLKQITLLCPIYWVAMLLLYREIIIITKAIYCCCRKLSHYCSHVLWASSVSNLTIKAIRMIVLTGKLPIVVSYERRTLIKLTTKPT